MDIWIVYHHSGEVIGIYDDEEVATGILMKFAGSGGCIETRRLNETIPA